MSDGCDGRREENDVQQSASFDLKALLFSFLVEFDDQEAVSASQLVFLFFLYWVWWRNLFSRRGVINDSECSKV